MLLSRRNAAMQFYVIRSVAPLHSVGCDGVCAFQDDGASYVGFAARETSFNLHCSGSDG